MKDWRTNRSGSDRKANAHRALKRLIVACTLMLPNVLSAQKSVASFGSVNVPGKWDLGVVPTVQQLSSQLAGSHVWDGGLTIFAARRVNKVLGVQASLLGAFAPQLNFRNSATFNSLSPVVDVEFHLPNLTRWDPYLTIGGGNQRFKFDDAPEGFASRRSYNFASSALGVRFPITPRINWRAQVSRQFAKYGSMPTFSSGISFRIHDAWETK